MKLKPMNTRSRSFALLLTALKFLDARKQKASHAQDTGRPAGSVAPLY